MVKNLKITASMVLIIIFLVSNLSLSFAMGPGMSPTPTESPTTSPTVSPSPSPTVSPYPSTPPAGGTTGGKTPQKEIHGPTGTQGKTTPESPTNQTKINIIVSKGLFAPVVAIIVATIIHLNKIKSEILYSAGQSFLREPIGLEAEEYLKSYWYIDKIVAVLTDFLEALIPYLP